MLVNAPPLLDVMSQFVDFIDDYPLLAHNAPFDKRFILQAAEQCSLSAKNPFINTISLAKKAYPALPSYSLSALKKTLSIDIDTAHRALPDVLATARLYELCCHQIISKSFVGKEYLEEIEAEL